MISIFNYFLTKFRQNRFSGLAVKCVTDRQTDLRFYNINLWCYKSFIKYCIYSITGKNEQYSTNRLIIRKYFNTRLVLFHLLFHIHTQIACVYLAACVCGLVCACMCVCVLCVQLALGRRISVFKIGALEVYSFVHIFNIMCLLLI